MKHSGLIFLTMLSLLPAGPETARGYFAGATATRPFADVRAFGARGDGVTDDRAAIQDAIDNTAVGTVYLPAGIYLVSPRPASGSFFSLHGNLAVVGDGPGITIIRVANSAGPYKYIFHGLAGPKGLDNLFFSNLTIDSNIRNNSIKNASEIESNPRVVIAAFGGVEFRVTDVEFINSSDINTVTFNGPSNARCYISQCTFRNMGDDPNHVQHDHSAIYAHADRVVIANNIFEGSGPGAPGATTAIETHGSNQIVTGNIVKNYRQGMNITGVGAEESGEIVVSGNSMSGVKHGIHLWSHSYGLHTAGYGLANVIVSNNAIRVRQYEWQAIDVSTHGIFFDFNDDLGVRNVTIANNIVEFDLESKERGTTSESGGIILWTGKDTRYENLNINNNTIVNAPSTGIKLASPIRNASVLGNKIVNAGSSSSSKLNWGYRAGILVAARDIDGLHIANNEIFESLSPARMATGISFVTPSGGVFRDIRVINNQVRVTGKDRPRFLYHLFVDARDDWTRPFVKMDVDEGWKMIPGTLRAGSRIYDAGNNRYYELHSDGNRWFSYAYGKTSPSSGTWNEGDKIWNTGNDGTMYWVCTVSGSPGAWKAMTGTLR